MRYPFTQQIVEINYNALPAGFDYLVFVNGLFKDMNNQQLDMIHAAMGIAGEAGEILELVKKNFAYGKVIDMEVLAKELGDLLFYFTAMCAVVGIDPEAVAEINRRKLSARYESGKYSDEQAINRVDTKK